MKLDVEDEFNDIIGKAQKGLGITTEELAEKSSVPESKIRKLRRGDLDEQELRRLGEALELNTQALIAIARGGWYPAQPDAIDGFAMVSSPFYDWSVNAFVVWDPKSLRTVLFDTGTKADPLIDFIDKKGLKVETLYLTPGHSDAVAGLDVLKNRYGCSIVVPEKEGDFSGASVVREGDRFELGSLDFEAISTPGHTEGGMSYLINGLERPLAIVGDALFAGSMGGPNTSYQDGLDGVKRLLELPEETVLAPGHGPLTTVREEREMNCFYRGS